jgi:ferrochelatase
MRNWKPFIRQGVEELVTAGVTRIIGIPLAPQFSTLSVAKYIAAATAELPSGVAFDPVRSFHAHPLLLEAFAERVREQQPGSGETIVFTAHSLPERVIREGDCYAAEVAATAAGVAERSAITSFLVAYQSAGRTPEPWLGPEIGDVIRNRAREGSTRFLIVPIGFVCDHTEILFDIDIQATAAAQSVGATLRRTASLNTSPTFISLLEDLVRSRL